MSGHPLLLRPDDFGPAGAGLTSPGRGPSSRGEPLEERLARWADGMCRRLESFGVWLVHQLEERPPKTSAERPVAWVVRFGRIPSSGSAHPSLALQLDSGGVEVMLDIPADPGGPLALLRRILDDAVTSAELVAAVTMLPDQFDLAAGGRHQGPCRTLDREQIAALLDEALAARQKVRISWQVPRSTALEHRAMLSEQLGDAVVSLASVFRLLPWGSDPEQHPPRPFERGDRVRVLAGPFAGRIGTVVDLDPKGGVRIMLGLLSARMDEHGLSPIAPGEGKRPALRSSHRRMPGRLPSSASRAGKKGDATADDAPNDVPSERPCSNVAAPRSRRARSK